MNTKHVSFNRRTCALLAAAGMAAVMSVTSESRGQTLNWVTAASGSAGTAGNWSPASVPVSTSDLVFNATAGTQTYTVTFGATTPTTHQMRFNEDNVTLSMTAAHTTTASVLIAPTTNDVANVSLTSGTWNISATSAFSFDIAQAFTTVGTLNVSGAATDLIMPSALAGMRVGGNGDGTLNVTGSGLVEVGKELLLGVSNGSQGTLVVSGAQSSLIPFSRSTFRTTSATGSTVFSDSGNATVTIGAGALVDLAGDLRLANGIFGGVNVTVGGAVGIFEATLDVGGDMFMSSNTTVQAAGSSALTVNNAGNVLVGGTLHVGDDPQGGIATLSINNGAVVSAQSVVDGASGTINHNGGTLKINGGTYTGHADPLVVTGTGSPQLQLSNGLSKTIAPVGAVGVIVGDDAGAGTFTGTLTIDSGADLILSGASKDINIGDDAGTTGTIVVTGAGSRLVATDPGDDIRVGFNGTGTVEVRDGAQLLARNILVPATALSGTGNMRTNGTGASTITTVNLGIGNTSGGPGNVSINPLGVLNVTDAAIGTVVRATGTLSIADLATMNATGEVLVDGGSLLVGGTLNASLVDVDGGTLESTAGSPARVDAFVHVRTGGLVEAVSNDLTLGTATGANALIFDSGSTMRVGASRTLSLMGGTTGITANGDIDMQGGTIVSGQDILVGGTLSDQLSGFGTIDANLRTSNSVCTPTGTGLVFMHDFLINGSFSAAGTSIRLAATCVAKDLNTAANVFNCKVVADAGSIMRPSSSNLGAFGPMTFGDGTITGVTLNGVIHLGTNGSLTFNDLNGVGLGTLTDMNGGSLTCTNGLSVSTGRILRGHGSLNVPNLGSNGFTLSGGTIDPDDYFADTDTYHGIGRFAVSGRYTQQATGTFLCEIAGFDNEFRPLNDRIDVSGPAVISGTLNVTLIDGYSATLCDTFTILTGTSVTGTFSNVIAPPNVRVIYNPTSVQLIVAGCPADFNQDCSVDPDDLADYIGCFFAQPPCDRGDINNDGTVDPDDLADFIGIFFNGCQ